MLQIGIWSCLSRKYVKKWSTFTWKRKKVTKMHVKYMYQKSFHKLISICSKFYSKYNSLLPSFKHFQRINATTCEQVDKPSFYSNEHSNKKHENDVFVTQRLGVSVWPRIDDHHRKLQVCLFEFVSTIDAYNFNTSCIYPDET